MKKITIRDIAKESNVSITTVSLIINNKAQNISPQTIKNVSEVIKKYNYKPNFSAASLVTKQTKTLGLIIPDISSPYNAELCKGIALECKSRGYFLFISDTDNNSASDINYIDVFKNRGVDGLIINLSEDLAGYELEQNALSQKEVKILFVDRNIPCATISHIGFDNEKGGYLATQHLIDLKHKKIGCITGNLKIHTSTMRLNGYIQALHDNGISFNSNLIFEGDFSFNSGFNGAKKLIDKGATAIFACNDTMAFGVYHQLEKMGLKIPDNISVVGYDDISFSEYTSPPLTTVNQPARQLGIEAARQMIDCIEDDIPMKLDNVRSPKLVIRKSTSAVM